VTPTGEGGGRVDVVHGLLRNRANRDRAMTSATYEIRVEGVVPPDVLENVEGVSSVAATTDTTLRAELADTAALNGLLAALRREGLVLLEVRRDLWAGDDDVLDIDDQRR
jgi:hypothetical protein